MSSSMTTAPAATSSSSSLMVPSQAVSSSNSNSNVSRNRRRRPRRPRTNAGKSNANDKGEEKSESAHLNAQAAEFVPPSASIQNNPKIIKQDVDASEPATAAEAATAPKKKKGRNRKNKVKKAPPSAAPAETERDLVAEQEEEQKADQITQENSNAAGTNMIKKRNRRKPKKKKNNNGRFPWRERIPDGAVDPISLDPLASLSYPPFALVATEPYEPIPEWPVPEPQQQNPEEGIIRQHQLFKKEDPDRERRILEEQWGDLNTNSLSTTGEATANHFSGEKSLPPPQETTMTPANKRYYHLFDGRVLAFYLVSQLQFIDPLNRRDLTRDELLNLDSYLKRYGLSEGVRVVEAYDAKGVTLSSAGAVAHTPSGRALMLQQEAGVLLNVLFGGGGSVALREARQQQQQQRQNNASSLANQYASHERQQQQLQRQRPTHENNADYGVYGEDDGGMILIDDDVNPGLRGGLQDHHGRNATTTTSTVNAVNTLWSASHIAQQYSHQATMQEANFPVLRPTSQQQPQPSETSNTNGGDSSTAVAAHSTNKQPPPKPSRSLLRISKTVAKTDPNEVWKQCKAREEARRKAMMANLAFGETLTPSFMEGANASEGGDRTAMPPSQLQPSGPTDGQLERNKALAVALGVAPTTIRSQQRYQHSGWARPTVAKIELDQFGNELNTAIYPDALILAARERMDLVLKLERQWKKFLENDTSASLPLRPMDRDRRKLVHEYSDFWKLHTESFDPEPKRYVHCVKLRDTGAPHPMLSEAAKTWRGPGTGGGGSGIIHNMPKAVVADLPSSALAQSQKHQQHQAAGESTRSNTREFPPPPDRIPLKLAPRSTPVIPNSMEAPPGTMFDLDAGTNISREAKGMAGEVFGEGVDEVNTRFSNLFEGRERAKLKLAPRTVPLELPPYEPRKEYNAAAEREKRLEERNAKDNRKVQEEERKRRLMESAFASSDEEAGGEESSEWEEEEALFSGDDEEE